MARRYNDINWEFESIWLCGQSVLYPYGIKITDNWPNPPHNCMVLKSDSQTLVSTNKDHGCHTLTKKGYAAIKLITAAEAREKKTLRQTGIQTDRHIWFPVYRHSPDLLFISLLELLQLVAKLLGLLLADCFRLVQISLHLLHLKRRKRYSS